MLKSVARRGPKSDGKRFAIVASRYNSKYVDSMLRSARKILAQSGASRVVVVRVPGAFEIPVVAAKFAALASKPFAAIICLGVILRGETTHAQHIAETVSHALAQIQLQYHVPIIHEVLLLENEAQAKARCLRKEHNRGAEAACTALEMAATMSRLQRIIQP